MKSWIPLAVVGGLLVVAAPAAAYVFGAHSIAGELALAAKKSDLPRLQRLTDVEAVTAGLTAARPGDPRIADHVSPKGLRGVLRKCDSRARSERALRTAPETAMVAEVRGHAEVVMRCTATEGGEVRLTVRRTGFSDWRIVKLELPAH